MKAVAIEVPAAAQSKLGKWAWGVLGYNILVIVWGAVVRATGSGAGCGEHWPLCNGTVIPVAPQWHTLIELTHRATSGLAFLSVIGLWLAMRRSLKTGHPARRAASFSLLFMVNETLVGALLVLLGLVAGSRSPWRAVVLALHLVNTLLLLASLALAAWWAGQASGRPGSARAGLRRLVIGGVVAVMVVSAAGGIAALGDTLFPASSVSAGINQEFAAGAPLLVRLRVLHPILAALTGVYLLWLVSYCVGDGKNAGAENWGYGVGVLVLAQFVIGGMNIVLLTPVWSQLTHLFVTDVLWVGLVIFSATVLGSGTQSGATSA